MASAKASLTSFVALRAREGVSVLANCAGPGDGATGGIAAPRIITRGRRALPGGGRCRFRKLRPIDSQLANQNMIAACLQWASCSSACYATSSSRDSSWKPRSWSYGISSISFSSAHHADLICGGPTALYSSGFIGAALAFLMP